MEKNGRITKKGFIELLNTTASMMYGTATDKDEVANMERSIGCSAAEVKAAACALSAAANVLKKGEPIGSNDLAAVVTTGIVEISHKEEAGD